MMKKEGFSGILKVLISHAKKGSKQDIDFILNHLTSECTFEITRYVDYSLSLVKNQEGIKQIKYYLFNGTLIQRNYCSLFFNRRGDWLIVKEAFLSGLIDEIQAFAR